jgi:hypothetical protein
VKSKAINLRAGVKIILLILSGDIAQNPGPTKFPCGTCSKPVAKNHRAVLCEVCNYWSHIKCAGILPKEYELLQSSMDAWICETCKNWHFTDSYFLTSPDSSILNLDSSSSSTDTEFSNFEELKILRKKTTKQISHSPFEH